MITNVNPEPGTRIYWGRTPMTVSRTAKPTFPGGVPLVYAEPISGGPETFLPSGSWAYEPFGDAPEVEAREKQSIHDRLDQEAKRLRDQVGGLRRSESFINGVEHAANIAYRMETADRSSASDAANAADHAEFSGDQP